MFYSYAISLAAKQNRHMIPENVMKVDVSGAEQSKTVKIY